MTAPPTALVLGAGWQVRVLDQDGPPNPRGASVDEHRLIRHAYGAQSGYMRMVDHAYRAWDALWRDLGEVLHVRTGVLATASEVEDIMGFARPRLRDAAAYRVLGARACHYDVEAGERFVIEALLPRGFVISGFSGHGFKFAPLLGLALARAAADTALASLLPGRAAGEAPLPPGLLAGLEHAPA